MRSEKIKKIFLVIIILAIGWLVNPLYTNVVKAETTNNTNIDYEIKEVNGTKANILILITDTDSGISKVEYPSGYTVYCNGGEKRTKLAIDYEAELGGEYVFKVTTGDGTEVEKKIVVINSFDVSISGITTTGFNIGLSLTSKELEKVEWIRYYVNQTSSGTAYQTSNVVTGLSDYTTRYVYAEISYNSGITKKSSYIYRVTTAHTHVASCYNTTYLNTRSWALTTGGSTGFYELCCNATCSGCGRYEYDGKATTTAHWISLIRDFHVDASDYKADLIHDDGGNACYKVRVTPVLDGNWNSSLRVSCYIKCSKCGSSIVFAKLQATSSSNFHHLHYTDTEDVLNCSKSTSGGTSRYTKL